MATFNEVPDRLEQFEVFKDGTRKIGVAEVTLPEIKFKTETMNGAGIAGDLEMPAPGQTESLELKLSWRTTNGNLTELLAGQSHDLELRGANLHYDSATGKWRRQAVKINVRGMPKSGNLGKFAPTSRADAETTLELTYMKMTIDGKKDTEIDKLNYICYIDGKDYLADLRAALGL